RAKLVDCRLQSSAAHVLGDETKSMFDRHARGRQVRELEVEGGEIVRTQRLAARRFLRRLDLQDAEAQAREKPLRLLDVGGVDRASDGFALERLRLIGEGVGSG